LVQVADYCKLLMGTKFTSLPVILIWKNFSCLNYIQSPPQKKCWKPLDLSYFIQQLGCSVLWVGPCRTNSKFCFLYWSSECLRGTIRQKWTKK
jgi:hypothetical protein